MGTRFYPGRLVMAQLLEVDFYVKQESYYISVVSHIALLLSKGA